MTPTRTTCIGRTAGLSSAILLAIVACSASSPEPARTAAPAATRSPTVDASPTTTPTPTPTPTVDPARSEAEEAVLQAYRGYWDGVVASFAQPSQPQSPTLAEYSDDMALADAQSALIQLRGDGIHLVGAPTLAPKVTDVDLGSAQTATIVDCVDASNWQPVFTDSGSSAAAPDQPTRLTYEATAFHPEDRWLIRTVTIHRDRPC